MAERMVSRTSVAQRVIHWIHGISFVILGLTGLALFHKSLFGLTSIFGGVDSSRQIHRIFAWIFTFNMPLFIAVWFKDCGIIDALDLKWVARGFGGYLPIKSLYAGCPPAGKFNAGQKMFYWTAVLGGILFIISGFILMYPLGLSKQLVRLSYILHDLATIGTITFFFAHLYLGTIGAPGSLRAIFQGNVGEEWAKHHHGRWTV